MSNDASGIHDELSVELVKGSDDSSSDDVSAVEPYAEGEKDVTDDGTAVVNKDILMHLLNYHNSCVTCNLNDLLGRRAD